MSVPTEKQTLKERLTMWKKVVPLFIVLSVALNIAFVAIWAFHAIRAAHCCVYSVRHDKVWCPLHRRLNVTDEQWREIEPRLQAFCEASSNVCAELNKSRDELIALIAATETDQTAIEARQEEILAGQRRMQNLVIEHLLSQKDVLTPVQQRKLFEMIRRRSGCIGQGPGIVPMAGKRSCFDTGWMKEGGT